MSNFFSNNIVLKTVSLISALILWVFVINTQNPLERHDVRNRNISIRGIDVLEEKGYVIKNESEIRDQKVRVVVKGPKLQIEKIKSNPDLVDIKIDITKYANNISTSMDMVAPIIPVDVSVPIGLTIVDQSPQNVEVIFEREKSVTKPIEYVINGGSNNEYETLTPKIVPEEIEVWGAESYMNEIAEVRIDIDVENFSEDVLTYDVPIKIYDAEGQELTELKKSHNKATVTLPIGKKKTVPLEMQFKGELPEGFIQTGIDLHPNSITIIGKPTLVDEITSIKLQEISLDNIVETSRIETGLILPKGITYLDKIDDSVTVTVRVKEQSVYNYNLDLSKPKINISNKKENYEYEILDDEIAVKVKAIAENLLDINPRNIEIDVDVKDYRPGDYSVPIKIQFPPEILVVEKPKVNIRVTEKITAQEPEEVPDPDAESGETLE
ncbi:MAG: hypothetical protein GX366_06370 [Epulopiscium sp.]|nr:hypothetical protein [Candidatus Epulonipiscium sp.]